jgi:hypothetical protein
MRQRDIIEVTIIDFIHGTRFHVSKLVLTFVLGICPHKALHQRLMFFKIMSHRQRTIMCQVDNNNNHASKNNAKKIKGRRVRCKDPVIEIDQSIPKLSN